MNFSKWKKHIFFSCVLDTLICFYHVWYANKKKRLFFLFYKIFIAHLVRNVIFKVFPKKELFFKKKKIIVLLFNHWNCFVPKSISNDLGLTLFLWFVCRFLKCVIKHGPLYIDRKMWIIMSPKSCCFDVNNKSKNIQNSFLFYFKWRNFADTQTIFMVMAKNRKKNPVKSNCSYRVHFSLILSSRFSTHMHLNTYIIN